MDFLSQGDFSFPFDFLLYWLKHFFVWSYQTGAVNLDGIIRLPSRLPYITVFGLGGNVMVGYFYILFSLLIIFASFYAFAARVLDIKSRSVRLIGSLFFALNPIYLGYLAKIGLMVGTAMLPLCFVVIDLAFEKKQFRYFILYILLLNISFIHPFTLTVNLLASGIYLLWRAKKQGGFLWKQRLQVIGVIALGIILNAYFLLPIMALGTVNKSALSEEISYTPVDYTALVDFANAGNPLQALSLSRDVLLDFRYYNFYYQPIYYAAVFIFYVILFGLYIHNERSLNKRDRSRIVLLLTIFLGLLLLSMAMFLGINRLLKMLVVLPGGWMFRSPLKWQLYIPFVLAALLSLLLVRTPSKRLRRTAGIVSVSMLLLMSIFLGVEIYRKLLVPRQFQYLGSLQKLDLNQKNFLFVSDNACFSFLQDNLDIVTEMNQTFVSKNVQLKRVQAANLDTIDLGSYDYVMGCKETLASPLKTDERFQQTDLYADKLALYHNNQAQPYIYATDRMFALGKVQNLSDKQKFAHKQGERFDFSANADLPQSVGLHDPFEAITLDNLKDSSVVTQPELYGSGPKKLWLNTDSAAAPLFYKHTPSNIEISEQSLNGFMQLSKGSPLELSKEEARQFTYIDPGTNRQNLIPNPSVEQGLWQQDVWDCYAYDDKPAISMKHNQKLAAEGQKSLELSAQAHIACSGPDDVAVKENSRYLLHIKYRVSPKAYGSVRVSFDDTDTTSLGDSLLAHQGNEWQAYNREIKTPVGAHNLKLVLSAYPALGGAEGSTIFDDFQLVEIPDLQGKLYMTEDSTQPTAMPAHLNFESNNPTRKTVYIEGAKQPFYLAMRDTYHQLWQAKLVSSGRAIKDVNHQKINGFMNGWYIDPAELCKDTPAGCTLREDGSYDIQLLLNFAPQQWFYRGLLVSGVAWGGLGYYFVYLGIKRYYAGGKRYWRARKS